MKINWVTYTVHYIVYIVQCTSYSVHCTVYTVHRLTCILTSLKVSISSHNGPLSLVFCRYGVLNRVLRSVRYTAFTELRVCEGVVCDTGCVARGMWHVACDTRCVARGMLHLECGMRCVTCGVWHATRSMWYWASGTLINHVTKLNSHVVVNGTIRVDSTYVILFHAISRHFTQFHAMQCNDMYCHAMACHAMLFHIKDIM